MRQIESFFWGIIAALGALTMQLLIYIVFSFFSDSSLDQSFSQIFSIPMFVVISAFTEEFFKYLIISKRIELFSLGKSYLTNSLLVGLGFFSIELGLIFLTMNNPPLGFLVEIAIIHIGTAGIIGYIIATRNPKKISTFLLAITPVIFLHSAYNFLVTDRDYVTNYIIYTILTIILLLNIINLFLISSRLAQDRK